jgi:hypothetical protein
MGRVSESSAGLRLAQTYWAEFAFGLSREGPLVIHDTAILEAGWHAEPVQRGRSGREPAVILVHGSGSTSVSESDMCYEGTWPRKNSETLPVKSFTRWLGKVSCDNAPELSLARLRRLERLTTFLSARVRDGALRSAVQDLAWKAWQDAERAAGTSLVVPDVSAAAENTVLFTWDGGEHHLELEVSAEDGASYFYRNRISGEIWGDEYAIGRPVPLEARARLALFA